MLGSLATAVHTGIQTPSANAFAHLRSNLGNIRLPPTPNKAVAQEAYQRISRLRTCLLPSHAPQSRFHPTQRQDTILTPVNLERQSMGSQIKVKPERALWELLGSCLQADSNQGAWTPHDEVVGVPQEQLGVQATQGQFFEQDQSACASSNGR